MKKIFILTIMLSSLLLATQNSNENTKAQQQLKKQMEKEKKYSQEQTFYKGDAFDLKSLEVEEDTLKSIPLNSIPELNEPDDDFDMDDVY